jgi:isochorismate pyruvate lyase
MSRAIDKVEDCATMTEVRRHVDALDDLIVPLLVQRGGYMTQAARVKNDPGLVRDEDRIEVIAARVRQRAAAEGGPPDVIEAIYRAMMEAYIAYEHRELARLQAKTNPA